MEQIIKEAREKLVGKEISLLEVDNQVLQILEENGNEANTDKNSIFNGDTREYIENGSYTYSYYNEDNDTNIDIAFKVIEDNENLFEVLIRVIEVEEI